MDSRFQQPTPEGGSVSQADYKKFVYSPRAQYSVYEDGAGKAEQLRMKTFNLEMG